jgi:hypothetical protein
MTRLTRLLSGSASNTASNSGCGSVGEPTGADHRPVEIRALAIFLMPRPKHLGYTDSSTAITTGTKAEISDG